MWVFEDGPFIGTAETWLEAYRDGTIWHHFLSLGRATGREARSVQGYRWGMRAGLNGLKDELESSLG